MAQPEEKAKTDFAHSGEPDIALEDAPIGSPQQRRAHEIDEIITASRKEIGNVSEIIHRSTVDEIAFHSKNYQFGSVNAIEQIQGAGNTNTPLTIALFEIVDLSKANSLPGDEREGLLGQHQAGNALVYGANEAVRNWVAVLDPEALVFRGPNGAIVVQSEKLTERDIVQSIERIEEEMAGELPIDFPARGVRARLRVGTSSIEPISGLNRDGAKEIYYRALNQVGAAAEYLKGNEERHAASFAQLTGDLDEQQRARFIVKHHNFIPPETSEGSLFTLSDQAALVKRLLAAARASDPEFDQKLLSHETSETLREVRIEATKLIAMGKRPGRFEDNVEAVHSGKEIPILNYRAATALQQRFIGEGDSSIPFIRADGDLDHLRDLFQQHPVHGADSHYGDFYRRTAEALREYETKNPGIRIFLEKQASSDEFGIIMVHVSSEQAKEIMEIAREVMAEVGAQTPFRKTHKVTGQEIERIGGTTATIASSLQEIRSAGDLARTKRANEFTLNLRKFIEGKNTAGSEQLSESEATSIVRTFWKYLNAYHASKNPEILNEVSQNFFASNLVLQQAGVPEEALGELSDAIYEAISDTESTETG